MQKLYENGSDPLSFRKIGITKSKATILSDLGLIEMVKIPSKTGKMPKNPNGARITPLGIRFLFISQQKNPSSLAISVLNEIRNEIQSLNKQLQDSMNALLDYSDSLQKVEERLGTIQSAISQQSSASVMDENKLFNEIQRLYEQYKGKVTPAAPIGKIVQELEARTPHSVKKIEEFLLKQYQERKIELIPGQSHESYRLITDDGAEYAFLRVL